MFLVERTIASFRKVKYKELGFTILFRFRKRAFNELLSLKVFKTSETESFGSDPWNVFVFSPSFLSIQMQNLTEIPVTVYIITTFWFFLLFCGRLMKLKGYSVILLFADQLNRRLKFCRTWPG